MEIGQTEVNLSRQLYRKDQYRQTDEENILTQLFQSNPATQHPPVTSTMNFIKSRPLVGFLSIRVSPRRCCSSSVVDLAYEDYNSNTDPSLIPLVISHGMLGSKHNWTSIAKQIHKTTGWWW